MRQQTRHSLNDTLIDIGQYPRRRPTVRATHACAGRRHINCLVAGTAILSKIKPLSVDYTLPGHPDPESVKGRIVTLEFESAYVIGTYVVNAGTGLKVRLCIPHQSQRLNLRMNQTLPEKNTWNKHFQAYIRALDAKKPVIWTGDLNVAPTELDLANPKTNWNKTPGYTEDETKAFKDILIGDEEHKMIDVWRHRNPELRHYTYFSYRFNCRSKGIGWRLDHCTS